MLVFCIFYDRVVLKMELKLRLAPVNQEGAVNAVHYD